MNGKQLQAAYSTRIMKENVQWIQKDLFFTTILFLCQYRLQPHTPWKYTIFCQKKNGYTEWLQYTASHNAISKTGQTKKKYTKACLDIGDLEQIP
jgi:hypothetical protein